MKKLFILLIRYVELNSNNLKLTIDSQETALR